MSTESVDDAVSLLRGWDILDGCDDTLLVRVRYFHAFSDLGAIIVTTEDEVYGIGQNGEHNLLGVEGPCYLQEVLEEPTLVKRLCDQEVVGISVGMWLGAAVTRRGQLFRWGFTSESTPIILPTSVELDADIKFVEVACGAAFLAALTDKHQVYIWGSMNMCTEPTEARLVSNTLTITSISCGWWHVAMLTDKGQVFTCGYGEDGQLGYNWYENDDIYSGKKIDIRPVIKQVVCGSISTLCLSTYGEIYACGENDIWQGSLGVDSEEYCIVAPKKVLIDATIKEITATWGAPNIYAALSTEGHIYCWGESRYPAFLKNISSLIEACRNERTSFELDKIEFPLDAKSPVKPLILQTSPLTDKACDKLDDQLDANIPPDDESFQNGSDSPDQDATNGVSEVEGDETTIDNTDSQTLEQSTGDDNLLDANPPDNVDSSLTQETENPSCSE